jgi:hypothetical protein
VSIVNIITVSGVTFMPPRISSVNPTYLLCYSALVCPSLVVNIILAMLFADTELGANSVVGLVFKHSADAKGRLQQGGQMMINFGGNQHDNYAKGIQIPVYAPALGLAGGYLRYLYDNLDEKRGRTKILGDLDEIKKEVLRDGYKFYPEKSKRQPTCFTKIKWFFIGKPIDPPDEISKARKEREEKTRKEVGSRQRHYYLFEVLKRLGLILLSPILASATWLILNQVGFGNQSVVLGAVCFSIGLVTDEAVEGLTKYAKRIFGVVEKAGTPKTDTSKTPGTM